MNCINWCFTAIIGFIRDFGDLFGDDYQIINEAFFVSKISRWYLRFCI
ncbi:protein of unknown function [Xenorhabdus bovienii]|uniref:Uncharacterized protein n=2 Tax=Xenorhabdus bovienii TaxID=40576 RepID=A0A0B6XFF9_XENBV|nr:hypothetical protein XBKB1_1200006 [Xenorhabdus bovienii str. kraussei Becker Underwood]CDM91593.1 protein of unknown function [Xenorhabdus bovienii]